MKIKNPFSALTRLEWLLWLISLFGVSASFLLAPQKDMLSLSASCIGVTALIFIAKGMVFGQFLTIVFSVFYGLISWHLRYYGEMITYLGMTAPMALVSMIAWLRHPYADAQEVAVNAIRPKQILLLCILTALVTFAFYFILRALHTARLPISTLSVTTSFFAASLTFLRSPYYALAYACNDLVLIVMWLLAASLDSSYFSMSICFIMFLLNDIYGYYQWRNMHKRQQKASSVAANP